jgi:ATP synthase protein I
MMDGENEQRGQDQQDKMMEDVGAKEKRKLRARRTKGRAMWFGLGMMGMIGWSVVVPTLLGVALGYWIESRWATGIPWTLILLLIGLAVGCLNAWHWVLKEQEQIEEDRRG